MICRTCLQRLSTSSRPLLPLTRSRFLSSTTPRADNTTPAPAATSTSAAQPLSTPLSPAPDSPWTAGNKDEHAGEGNKLVNRPASSVPGGTPLKGVDYIKGKTTLALEDSEYPSWLWSLLDEGGKDGEVKVEMEGDAYAKSKKQRRLAARAAARAAKLNPAALAPKIPIEEQTVNLADGSKAEDATMGALDAAAARKELTAAMRSKRRKGIKEGNFLKGMR